MNCEKIRVSDKKNLVLEKIRVSDRKNPSRKLKSWGGNFEAFQESWKFKIRTEKSEFWIKFKIWWWNISKNSRNPENPSFGKKNLSFGQKKSEFCRKFKFLGGYYEKIQESWKSEFREKIRVSDRKNPSFGKKIRVSEKNPSFGQKKSEFCRKFKIWGEYFEKIQESWKSEFRNKIRVSDRKNPSFGKKSEFRKKIRVSDRKNPSLGRRKNPRLGGQRPAGPCLLRRPPLRKCAIDFAWSNCDVRLPRGIESHPGRDPPDDLDVVLLVAYRNLFDVVLPDAQCFKAKKIKELFRFQKTVLYLTHYLL